MPKLIHVFVGGDSFVDKAIQHFSHAEAENITHVAVLIAGSTFESLGIKDEDDPYPGAWFHRQEKYFNHPAAKFVAVDIPDLPGAINRARQLQGTPYGYPDCISILIAEVLKSAPEIPDSLLTSMCAGTATETDRGGGLNIEGDKASGRITPVELYWELINNHGGVDITDRFRGR